MMGGRRKASASGIFLPPTGAGRKEGGREGGIGPHEALKINVLLAKENLAGSTLSHSFVRESG